MAKIHGISYLIIGAAVILISLYSNARSGTNSMTLFIYVGIIFLIVGIIKLFLKFIKRQNKPKQAHKPVQHHHAQVHHQQVQHAQHTQPRTHHSSHPHHPQHTQHQQVFPQYIVCPKCHARNHTHSNFCMRCGLRFTKP